MEVGGCPLPGRARALSALLRCGGVAGVPSGALGGGGFPWEPVPFSGLGVRKGARSIASHKQQVRFGVGGNSLGTLGMVFCIAQWTLPL